MALEVPKVLLNFEAAIDECIYPACRFGKQRRKFGEPERRHSLLQRSEHGSADALVLPPLGGREKDNPPLSVSGAADSSPDYVVAVHRDDSLILLTAREYFR